MKQVSGALTTNNKGRLGASVGRSMSFVGWNLVSPAEPDLNPASLAGEKSCESETDLGHAGVAGAGERGGLKADAALPCPAQWTLQNVRPPPRLEENAEMPKLARLCVVS